MRIRKQASTPRVSKKKQAGYVVFAFLTYDDRLPAFYSTKLLPVDVVARWGIVWIHRQPINQTLQLWCSKSITFKLNLNNDWFEICGNREKQNHFKSNFNSRKCDARRNGQFFFIPVRGIFSHVRSSISNDFKLIMFNLQAKSAKRFRNISNYLVEIAAAFYSVWQPEPQYWN